MSETTPVWLTRRVDEICELGRGRVISQEEIQRHPGVYPVFSSQSKDEGVFGALDTYDFEGDYVTWTTDGANAGTVFFRTGKFNCTNVCGTLKPKSLDTSARFLTRALSNVAKKYVSYVGNPKLMNNIMAGIQIRMPPRIEQDSIAAVLDMVDEAIAKTEAVIAKLKQVRAGLLHDLLARGLDEHGQLRDPVAHPEQFQDSPLGRIPREWVVEELRSCYAVPSRNGLYKKATYYGSGYRMVHMPQMFKALRIDISEAARVDVEAHELQRYALEEGDLLFARRSLNLEGAGLCALVEGLQEPATFESSIIRVRMDKTKVLPRFAAEFLRSDYGYLRRRPYIRQVAVSGVSSEDVGCFLIPRPAPDEQSRMLAHLRAHDQAIDAYEMELIKLLRLKSGVMNDLLTGRVPVPESE